MTLMQQAASLALSNLPNLNLPPNAECDRRHCRESPIGKKTSDGSLAISLQQNVLPCLHLPTRITAQLPMDKLPPPPHGTAPTSLEQPTNLESMSFPVRRAAESGGHVR